MVDDESGNDRGLARARVQSAETNREHRGRWFAGASIIAAAISLAMSSAAYAQVDVSSAAKDDAGIGNGDDAASSDGDIVITGTRLSTLRNAPNPVQSLDAKEISQTGRTTALEIMRLMPQTNNNIGGNTTANYVNGAGLNIVDLRGLGPYRTLTLVNGRRQIGSMGGLGNSGLTSQVDINRIPVALIERVDVVTGGTSAQYGADAVAGVVNFILKDRFEGVDISATQRLTQDGGGSSTSVNAVFGAKFAENKGHIVVAASFDRASPIYASQRDFAMRNISLLNNPANRGPADGIPNRVSVCCTVSSTTPASGTGLILTPIGSANPFTLTFSPDGSHLIPFNRGTQLNISSDPRDPTRTGDTVSIGGDGVNSSIPRVLQTPYRRLNAYMVADYLVSDRIGIFDDVTAFTEMSYSETQVKYDSASAAIIGRKRSAIFSGREGELDRSARLSAVGALSRVPGRLGPQGEGRILECERIRRLRP
jgi:iron complex outermembrane receptor protein